MPAVVAKITGASNVDISDRIGRLLGKTTNYDVLANGTLTELESAVEIAAANLSVIGVGISGTWVGTIVAEGTIGDGVWYTIPIAGSTLNTLSLSTTANGNFHIITGGNLTVRIRMSLYTSGTAVVYLEGSSAPAGTFLGKPLPTGTNSIGNVGIAAVSTFYQQNVTVTTARTPVQPNSQTGSVIILQPYHTNTDSLYWGTSAVDALSTPAKGIELLPGGIAALPFSNANLLYIDAKVSGEGCHVTVY